MKCRSLRDVCQVRLTDKNRDCSERCMPKSGENARSERTNVNRLKAQIISLVSTPGSFAFLMRPWIFWRVCPACRSVRYKRHSKRTAKPNVAAAVPVEFIIETLWKWGLGDKSPARIFCQKHNFFWLVLVAFQSGKKRWEVGGIHKFHSCPNPLKTKLAKARLPP